MKPHPEDLIYSTKVFVNELQKVQEDYFNILVNKLNLNAKGEEWLFDYIYNTTEQHSYDGFEHYLESYKQDFKNLLK
jgi:hypothetical protein